jgi:2-O-methyltransferase
VRRVRRMNRLGRRFTRHAAAGRRALGQRLASSQHTPTIPFTAAAPFLPADPVIVEAGASIGMDLAELLKVWPQARIHAFEPEPTTFAELQRRAGPLERVTPWPLALGRENGEIELNVSQGEHGTMSSSLLEPALIREAHPEVTYDVVKVRQQTLSSWATENGVDRIDFLALDMQGFEHAALGASRDVLGSASVVLSEAFLVPMYDGAATVDQLQALLTEQRFVILETRIYWARIFEVLAVSRDALERAICSGSLPAHGSAGSLD